MTDNWSKHQSPSDQKIFLYNSYTFSVYCWIRFLSPITQKWYPNKTTLIGVHLPSFLVKTKFGEEHKNPSIEKYSSFIHSEWIFYLLRLIWFISGRILILTETSDYSLIGADPIIFAWSETKNEFNSTRWMYENYTGKIFGHLVTDASANYPSPWWIKNIREI